METDIIKNFRNQINSEIKLKIVQNINDLDNLNKIAIIKTSRLNSEDYQGLLEEKNIHKTFNYEEILRLDLEKMSLFENNNGKQEFFKLMGLKDSDMISEIKIKSKNLTSPKGQIKMNLERDILGTPLRESYIFESDIISREKLRKEKKFLYELHLFDKRKTTYNKETTKKNESFDKNLRNKQLVYLTKSDKSLVNIYINKIKFYTIMLLIFVLINLTLNIVDISLFTIEFNRHFDLLYYSQNSCNYNVIFRFFNKSNDPKCNE